jgi:pimeloyl-ACP methyl ester carboxylesterase
VWAYEPTALRALLTTLMHWQVWRKVVRWKYSNFRYAFVHTLPPAEARAAYDRYVVPESGRIFFQASIAPLHAASPTRVDFSNGARAPLLLVAGAKDRIVPPVINRRNVKAYAKSAARTDFREFPDRTHWIIAQPGWNEVAEHIAGWLEALELGPST